MSWALALLLSSAAGADDATLGACRECHRVAGRVDGNVPIIEGQNRPYLEVQLERFRDRHRDVFPMNALVAGFDDADVARVAKQAAVLAWPAPRAPRVARQAAARGAERAAALACSACHGEGYRGLEIIPRLAGQHAPYLERQIRAFASGRRYHPPTGIGARMYRLDAGEIEALAAYLQTLEHEP
jgi:cytochrome c553